MTGVFHRGDLKKPMIISKNQSYRVKQIRFLSFTVLTPSSGAAALVVGVDIFTINNL